MKKTILTLAVLSSFSVSAQTLEQTANQALKQANTNVKSISKAFLEIGDNTRETWNNKQRAAKAQGTADQALKKATINEAHNAKQWLEIGDNTLAAANNKTAINKLKADTDLAVAVGMDAYGKATSNEQRLNRMSEAERLLAGDGASAGGDGKVAFIAKDPLADAQERLNKIVNGEQKGDTALARMTKDSSITDVAVFLNAKSDSNKATLEGNKNAIADNKDDIKATQTAIVGNVSTEAEYNAKMSELYKATGEKNVVDSVISNRQQINLNQQAIKGLQKDVERLDGAIASMAAMSNLVTPRYAGETVVAVGVGYYENNTALALGLTHNFNEQLAGKVSVAANTDSNNVFVSPVVGGSIGYSF